MSMTVLIHGIIITLLAWEEVGACGVRTLDFHTGAGKHQEKGRGAGFVPCREQYKEAKTPGKCIEQVLSRQGLLSESRR